MELAAKGMANRHLMEAESANEAFPFQSTQTAFKNPMICNRKGPVIEAQESSLFADLSSLIPDLNISD